MMLLFLVKVAILFLPQIFAISIKGELDIHPNIISNLKVSGTYFKLQQIGNITSDKPYKDIAYVHDSEGHFSFDDVPVNLDINETTQFVISPISKEFNLKPNRVLVEYKMLENGTLQSKAFKNYFGREYFPSKDIVFPESLDEIEMEPTLTFSLVQKQPYRLYLQVRNNSILKSGPLASILNSRWKMALVITGICLLLFPVLVEKLDPETAKAIKLEAQRKQKAKYEIRN